MFDHLPLLSIGPSPSPLVPVVGRPMVSFGTPLTTSAVLDSFTADPAHAHPLTFPLLRIQNDPSTVLVFKQRLDEQTASNFMRVARLLFKASRPFLKGETPHVLEATGGDWSLLQGEVESEELRKSSHIERASLLKALADACPVGVGDEEVPVVTSEPRGHVHFRRRGGQFLEIHHADGMVSAEVGGVSSHGRMGLRVTAVENDGDPSELHTYAFLSLEAAGTKGVRDFFGMKRDPLHRVGFTLARYLYKSGPFEMFEEPDFGEGGLRRFLRLSKSFELPKNDDPPFLVSGEEKSGVESLRISFAVTRPFGAAMLKLWNYLKSQIVLGSS